VLRSGSSEERNMPTVLIVDDYAAVRSAIRVGLERYSFSVCGEAVDGVEAIEKATQLNPDFILLDLAMPSMNGVETASVLKGLMPHVPIIAFSMYAELLSNSLPSTVCIDAVVAKSDGVRKVVECARNLMGVAAT
jgi:CheY-like chemotaxis protein